VRHDGRRPSVAPGNSMMKKNQPRSGGRRTNRSVAASRLDGLASCPVPGAHAPGYESTAASRLDGLASCPIPGAHAPGYESTAALRRGLHTPPDTTWRDVGAKPRTTEFVSPCNWHPRRTQRDMQGEQSDDAPRPRFPENRSPPHRRWSRGLEHDPPSTTPDKPLITPTPPRP